MKWQVPAEQKLIAFLQGRLGSYSGKLLRKMLEANVCRINGRVERFGSRVVKGGDAVELCPSWKSLLTPQVKKIDTLFENEHFKIINKPINWVCVDSEVKQSFSEELFLVHRLDKDTTGLLILAKNRSARDLLMGLFERKMIQKQYLALVDGIPKEESGERRSLLGKKGFFQGQTIWGSVSQGLTAITKWKTLFKGSKASLVLCEPETGRTHQIRVHMAEMGHPILVDRQYAKSFRSPLFVGRPLLHAHRLNFTFQENEIEVTAPLPLDFSVALKGCGIEFP